MGEGKKFWSFGEIKDELLGMNGGKGVDHIATEKIDRFQAF
jgi:hypothetical protein